MARKYKNVQGTNDFLVAAIGLLLLGLWAVRDGWFPTKKTLEKHPITVESHFDYAGTVSEISAEVGTTVSSNSPVALLQTDELDRQQEEAERELERLEEELEDAEMAWLSDHPDAGEQELQAEKQDMQQRINALKKEIAGFKQNRMKRVLRSNVNGEVAEIPVEIGEEVEEGDVGVVVHTEDHFYTFNKSLAIGSLLGALVCAILHLKLK